jgi:hypothetical protein
LPPPPSPAMSLCPLLPVRVCAHDNSGDGVIDVAAATVDVIAAVGTAADGGKAGSGDGDGGGVM